jgi:hypothetical protein
VGHGIFKAIINIIANEISKQTLTIGERSGRHFGIPLINYINRVILI